jgi:hypothetical protein
MDDDDLNDNDSDNGDNSGKLRRKQRRNDTAAVDVRALVSLADKRTDVASYRFVLVFESPYAVPGDVTHRLLSVYAGQCVSVHDRCLTFVHCRRCCAYLCWSSGRRQRRRTAARVSAAGRERQHNAARDGARSTRCSQRRALDCVPRVAHWCA